MLTDKKLRNLPTGRVDNSRRIYVRETRTWKAAKGCVMMWDWQAWEKKWEDLRQEKESKPEASE